MRRQLIFLTLVLCLGTLCAAEDAYAQTVQYFPQLTDGGGWVTTWYFTGLGDGPASVTIDLFNPSGAPLVLATNRGTASSFTFSLAATGQLTLRTNGSGSTIQVGWVRVTSSQPIGATEVFQLLFGGQVVSQAGVLPSDPTAASTLFVSIDGRGRNTGVAIANVSLSSNPVSFTLYNQSGVVVATSTFTLGPQAQFARFINELPGFEQIGAFEGSLGVSALSRFSLVTLVLDGVQLSTLPTLAGRLTRSASSLAVSGITDIGLAGMPAGFSVGSDSVPLNSPVEAGLGLVAGKSILITASGSVKDGNDIVGPSGSPTLTTVRLAPPQNGIGDMTGPLASLIGVFLGPAQPALPRPPTLDFSGGGRDVLRVQPLLQQPFYIGRGISTSGTAKEFVIPDGATRLYLGVLDTTGGNSRNTGFFTVTLTMTP